MCLILLAYQQHPDYRLVLIANRDEFYRRPSAALQFWHDQPQVLAGRDLVQQGTWMGITRSGRFAAITNYREIIGSSPTAPSRGHLVANYLTGDQTAETYLKKIQSTSGDYSGFNLIVGDSQEFYYFGNRDGRIRQLEPGIHGLSNRLLDSNWPKVRSGKQQLARILHQHPAGTRFDVQKLLKLLQNQELAPDDQLPNTGVGLERERMLSPIFISSPDYGTRCSSVLLIDREGQMDFREITWSPDYEVPVHAQDRHFVFRITNH